MPEKGGLHAFCRAVEAYGEGAVRGTALVAEHAALGITHKKLAVRKGRAAAPQGRQAFQHGDDVRLSAVPVEIGAVERVFIALHTDLVPVIDAGDARQRE